MVSSHTHKELRRRTQEFWINEQLWQEDLLTDSDFIKINEFLTLEYNTIPTKERIGKGRFFIAKVSAKGIISLISHHHENILFESVHRLFLFAEKHDYPFLRYFCLVLAGEIAVLSNDLLSKIFDLTLKWVDHPDWEVRETAGYIIRRGLKYQPEFVLSALDSWITSPSENVRRAVAESLRPLAEIKWLRDPVKNDQILILLSQLKCDSSAYVRTSVGNNLKDLTKYMPEKILALAEQWILGFNITVTEDLASRSKKDLGINQFLLIWTLKHAFRWIQKRNPEFHPRLTHILGQNYIDYYDEKHNRLAQPKK
ncbi:MAG: DNA alkylation repair protein [Candidatus Hodarchaeales archaeon]